jgi:hypothetical protein
MEHAENGEEPGQLHMCIMMIILGEAAIMRCSSGTP